MKNESCTRRKIAYVRNIEIQRQNHQAYAAFTNFPYGDALTQIKNGVVSKRF
jgi:hypothetical protein